MDKRWSRRRRRSVGGETICSVQFGVKLEKFPQKLKIRSQFFFSSSSHWFLHLLQLLCSSNTAARNYYPWVKAKRGDNNNEKPSCPPKEDEKKKIITSTISFFHVPPSPGRFNWPLGVCVWIWNMTIQSVSQPGPRLMECDGETTTIDTLCSLADWLWVVFALSPKGRRRRKRDHRNNSELKCKVWLNYGFQGLRSNYLFRLQSHRLRRLLRLSGRWRTLKVVGPVSKAPAPPLESPSSVHQPALSH